MSDTVTNRTSTNPPAPACHTGAEVRRLLGDGIVDHPLSPLTADEIGRAHRALGAAEPDMTAMRIAYLGLDEPHKDVVAAHTGAAPIPRRARALVIDLDTGTSKDVVVDLGEGAVVTSRTIDPLTGGQVPLLAEEHELIRDIVAADGPWCAALARRGIDDPRSVCLAALSAGHYEIAGEAGRRLARVLGHLQPHPGANPWAHPIDGLVAYVDLGERRVLDVIDTGVMPVPTETGDYHVEGTFGPTRTSLRPIEITQPDGPSFTVDGAVVRWENWSLRLGYDMREGLVLHEVGFDDGGRTRSIVHRASVAEMVVPYGDPSPVRFWQNYFDTGEYQLGRLVNSLELGCDCLGDITYLDVAIPAADGTATTVRNAICMHEEDDGVLWKHTEVFNDTIETRRSRKLVISFFVTVGNYDYGFSWNLYLDGRIELEAKATGLVFTSAYDDRAAPYASELAPGLAGPYHQHLFCARLDMAVDGVTNAVDEVDLRTIPMGADNPHGNAFGQSVTRLRTESEAQRVADGALDRSWYVRNPNVTNRLGQPVGYALRPEAKPLLAADPASVIARRAAFATRHLWVTRYDPAERYPAGDLVNQHPGDDGVAAYAAADRSIDGEDIVLWHTFGLTHAPRTEDWPIMPVDVCRMVLQPVNFFDRNPTLDVPRHPGHAAADAGGVSPATGGPTGASGG